MEADFNVLTTDRRVTQNLYIAATIPPNVKSIAERKMSAIRLAPLDPNIDSIGRKFRLSFCTTFTHLANFPHYWILIYAKHHRKRKHGATDLEDAGCRRGRLSPTC